MKRQDKLLQKAIRNPAGIRFKELCALVEEYGFILDRQAGSHLIYLKPGLPRITLQMGSSGKAKAYQVRQVIKIIADYNLAEE